MYNVVVFSRDRQYVNLHSVVCWGLQVDTNVAIFTIFFFLDGILCQLPFLYLSQVLECLFKLCAAWLISEVRDLTDEGLQEPSATLNIVVTSLPR